jgi:alpha-beta hydrolase superfamily lysophospholipase
LTRVGVSLAYGDFSGRSIILDEQEFVFTSIDGQLLTATVVLPQDSIQGAAILVHGVTSERSESGFYTSLARDLATKGIASIRADWRCHGSNALPTSELTLAGIVNDIEAAYAAFRTRYPTRGGESPLVVVAASFGGGVAAVWAARSIAEIRGIVLLAPVIDYAADLFRDGEIDSNGYLAQPAVGRLNSSGSIPTTSVPVGRALVNELPHFRVLEALSSASLPITIFHGDADTDVPISSSETVCEQIRSCNLIAIPDVDHGFVVPGTDFDAPETQAIHSSVIPRIAQTVSALIE